MAWIVPVAAAAAQLYGSASGQRAAKEATDAANDKTNSYLAQLAALKTPDLEKMRLALEGYQSAGQFTNQQETPEQLAARDAMQNIALDPRLKQTQMNQLESLQKLGETGISPEEQAQLNAMRRQTEADNQARMKSLLEQQQTRGIASGEGALAARMLGTQSSANRQAEGADSLAAMAFNRALQAKAGAANLAGNMESADYGRQSQLAQALNSRELQNVGLRSGAQQRNVDRFNQAQAANLSNQQRLMEANAALKNDQQRYNKGLFQQDFQNQLAKLAPQGAAISDYNKGVFGQFGTAAQAAAGGQRMGAGAASAITNVAGAFGSSQKTQDTNDYQGYDGPATTGQRTGKAPF